MKKLILILGATVLFASCKNNSPETNGSAEPSSVVSEIKEAISSDKLKSVKYETETTMPEGMGSASSKIITDDYGKKTRTETITAMSFGGKSMNTTANTLLLDDYVYTWSNMSKNGSKFKVDPSKFDPNTTDIAELTEEMRTKMNFKDEGRETIDGKDCKVVSFTMEGMKAKMWNWKSIPVQMEMSMMGKVITSKVKNIEENPSIPAGTFDVPADIEFKEMTMPSTAQK